MEVPTTIHNRGKFSFLLTSGITSYLTARPEDEGGRT
jgi:hypothetical protein